MPNQALDEYKERLRIAVNRATCDLQAPEQSAVYAAGMTREQLLGLVAVLNAELHQVKAVVLQAR